MEQISFKKTVRRLTAELVAAVILVGFGANVPEHVAVSEAWKFVLRHPNLLLHVAVGSVILVESVVLLARSARAHNKAWIAYSVAGLLFVLLAYGSGELFVAEQKESLLSTMTLGWLGALVIYSVAWARNRKRRVPKHM